MKVTKLPDACNTDLFCENNKTKLKSDCIVEETIRCPFCNAETKYINFCKEEAWFCFVRFKGIYVYTKCECEKCGAKWESNKYLVKSLDSVGVIHRQVTEKCRALLKRKYLNI